MNDPYYSDIVNSRPHYFGSRPEGLRNGRNHGEPVPNDFPRRDRMSYADRMRYNDLVERQYASSRRTQSYSEIARERIDLIGDNLRANVEAVSQSVTPVLQTIGRFFEAIWNALPNEERFVIQAGM